MYDLYRIISGVIRTKYLVVKAPSLYTLMEAEEIYKKTHEKAYSEKIITRKQLKELIIDSGALPADYENQIRILRNKIEDFKVDYYEDYLIPSQREKNLKNIEDMEFSITAILSIFAKYSQLTCSSIAETAKNLHILTSSTFKHNGDLYDWEHISINQLQNYIYGVTVDEKEIRDLSISPEWRRIWGIKDECSIFDKRSYELTTEQQDLISWSKFYDSIFESTEKPSEDIIKDCNAIDGWAIKNRRDYESSKEDVKISDKFGDAQEVFKVGNNAEDIRAIRNMNSNSSKSIQDKRFASLE